jgi:chromate transporter
VGARGLLSFGGPAGQIAVMHRMLLDVVVIVLEAVLRIGGRALRARGTPLVAVAAFIAICLFEVPFPLIILILGAAVAGYVLGRSRVYSRNRAPPGRRLGCGLVDGVRLRREAPATSLASAARTASLWLLVRRTPVALAALVLGGRSTWVQEGLFLSQAAVDTFGGAYAVLAYIAQRAVETYQWLGPGEMLDGLGMAETTSGPLIMVVQFVGFMAAYRNRAAPATPARAHGPSPPSAAETMFLGVVPALA